MQYMAAGPKCPLSPPPGLPLPPGPPTARPPPPTATDSLQPDPTHTHTHKDSMTGGGQGGPSRIDEQGRIDNITDAARDFALQLP